MKRTTPGVDPSKVDENRQQFLGGLGITLEQTSLVQMSYDREDFTRYKTIDSSFKGDGIVRGSSFTADALATQVSGLALFLPLADCIGAILFDPDKKALMVSHLGRHNIEQQGATKSVNFMKREFGTSAEELLVWLGPAPSKEDYPLFAFDNRSMHDVVMTQLQDAGVKESHIETCPADTVNGGDYYSHSQFKKGHSQEDGRFAIVAMIV